MSLSHIILNISVHGVHIRDSNAGKNPQWSQYTFKNNAYNVILIGRNLSMSVRLYSHTISTTCKIKFNENLLSNRNTNCPVCTK